MARPEDLEARLARMEADLRELRRRQALANTGMTVVDQGVTAVGGLLQGSGFDGNLDTGDVGTTGWALGPDKAAMPELLLRPGSVGNDALANPVKADSAYDYTTNFALSTALTNIRTKTIAVPAGFTTVAVALTVRVYAINNTAGLDYLFSQANVNGYNGIALPVPASGSNGSAMNVSTFAVVLSGASLGSTLTLQVATQTQFGGWAANPSNAADLSASIAWYR